jgi:hypothetical protein
VVAGSGLARSQSATVLLLLSSFTITTSIGGGARRRRRPLVRRPAVARPLPLLHSRHTGSSPVVGSEKDVKRILPSSPGGRGRMVGALDFLLAMVVNRG